MTAPQYPPRRRRLLREAVDMVNSRSFISINNSKPFGVRGELYDALVMVRELAREVQDMQVELDSRG